MSYFLFLLGRRTTCRHRFPVTHQSRAKGTPPARGLFRIIPRRQVDADRVRCAARFAILGCNLPVSRSTQPLRGKCHLVVPRILKRNRSVQQHRHAYRIATQSRDRIAVESRPPENAMCLDPPTLRINVYFIRCGQIRTEIRVDGVPRRFSCKDQVKHHRVPDLEAGLAIGWPMAQCERWHPNSHPLRAECRVLRHTESPREAQHK